jgi:P27 family predicted phage terminase small subunit
MARGRKPIAAEVHKANGTYRIHPERQNKAAPVADGNDPEMPDDFEEHERRKWKELCNDLRKNGVLSSDNREILISYCTAYAGWMKARQLIKTTGIVLVEKGKDGKRTISRNPISVELHKYREEMNRLLPELGLTPASRQKLTSLKLDDDNADDPFAGLMERMGRG